MFQRCGISVFETAVLGLFVLRVLRLKRQPCFLSNNYQLKILAICPQAGGFLLMKVYSNFRRLRRRTEIFSFSILFSTTKYSPSRGFYFCVHHSSSWFIMINTLFLFSCSVVVCYLRGWERHGFYAAARFQALSPSKVANRYFLTSFVSSPINPNLKSQHRKL